MMPAETAVFLKSMSAPWIVAELLKRIPFAL